MEFWLFVLKDGYLYDVSDEIIILSTVISDNEIRKVFILSSTF